MLIIRLMRFVRGYAVLSVVGGRGEEFLNICAARGVSLWRVRRGSGLITVSIARGDIKRAEECAAVCGISVYPKRIGGIPEILKKYKRRYALFAGAAVAGACIFFMSSFIWTIEVSGNERVSEEQILKTLEAHGFKEGVFKGGIDYYMLYQKILLDEPELSWITLNIKGTKAEVEVSERVMPPEIADTKTPTNIVAAKAGLLEEVLVFSGNSLVKAGMTVEKGDLLVSSVMPAKDGSSRLVASSARITARTWYKFEYICDAVMPEIYKTGKSISRYTLKIFNFEIKFFLNSGIPMDKYDRIITEKQLSLGSGYYLPVFWIKEEYDELAVYDIELDEDMQRAVSRTALENAIEKHLPGARVVSESFDERRDGGRLITYMEIECLEDIALKISAEG